MSRRRLEVTGLVAGYEPGSPIVNGASFGVGDGELVAILGANGAGKSTLVKAVAGLVPIAEGRVCLDGRDLAGTPAHRLPACGLAYVPQTQNVFANLTVEENLALAADLLPAVGRRDGVAAGLALFPDLDAQRRLLAGRLSGGQRQMLAVARALIAAPRVLLLDEPSAGLSPKVVGDLCRRLREVCSSGVSVVLVEQNVRAALAIADRLYVLADGRNRMEGPAADLAGDPAVAMLLMGTQAPAGTGA